MQRRAYSRYGEAIHPERTSSTSGSRCFSSGIGGWFSKSNGILIHKMEFEKQASTQDATDVSTEKGKTVVSQAGVIGVIATES